MQTLLVILIVLSIALGHYEAIVKRGAMIVKLDRKLLIIAVLCGLFNLCVAAGGYALGRFALSRDLGEREFFWINIVAGILLLASGLSMLIRAYRSRRLLEHRMDSIDLVHDTILELRLCLYSFVGGTVCGLLSFRMLFVVIAFALGTAVFSAAGYISGRFFGMENGRPALAIGGGTLCAIGIAIQFL